MKRNAVNGKAPLGIAIVGCGYWGVNYVRVFHEIPGVRVVAICDLRPDRLEELGKRFPSPLMTTRLEDLLQLPSVEAVAICTSATTHFEVASRCLTAGKHVLIEKPLATSEVDAEELVRLADARSVTFMVGHTFLYNSGIAAVKAYLDRGELGRVYYLYARRTNLGPIRRDVNAVWDLAPHDVSIFNHLLGTEPQWIAAVGAKVLRNSREDVAFITLGYPDDVIGNIHVSWADPNKVRELVVVGSEKRIAFDDVNPVEQVRVFEKGVTPSPEEAPSYGEYRLLIRDGAIISPRVAGGEPLKNQCLHFLECIARGETPLTNGRNGLEVVRVMTAIDSSISQGGVPVVIRRATPSLWAE